jgi:hypothetical protein
MLNLDGVEFLEADAGLSDAYGGAIPADILLVCGVFGNITDDDIHRTIRYLPQLCAAGALVVWTRGRFQPDMTTTIRAWFAPEFEEVEFVAIPGSTAALGAHRLVAKPRPPARGVRMFTFLPDELRPSRIAEQQGGP